MLNLQEPSEKVESKLVDEKRDNVSSKVNDTSSSQPNTFAQTKLEGLRERDIQAAKEMQLAQVLQPGSACHRSQDRNKADLVEFYSIRSDASPFTDQDFPPDDTSLFWADQGEGSTRFANDGATYVTWKRASDVYGDHTLFGSNGITPSDVRQGYIGNCWFLAAASALAEIPGRLE